MRLRVQVVIEADDDDAHQAPAVHEVAQIEREALSVDTLGLHLKEAGVKPGMKARDVWAATDLGTIKDDYKYSLKRHSMLLLRFSK